MRRGEINNERTYLAHFANQIEEGNANVNLYNFSMGPSGNNLQQFNTVDALNYLPNAVLAEQVGNEGIFPPQMIQHPNFQSNIVGQQGEGLYGVGVNDRGNINPNIDQNQYAAILFHRGNNTDLDLETMLSMNHDNLQGMKRKADEDYGLSYSGAKRRITDEHMAGEMNNLYITNDHNYCGNAGMFNLDDDLNMQFGTISDQQNNDDDSIDNVDQRKQKEHSVFQFSAPLEQMLKKKSEIDILPHKIIQAICKPCLAMVPWTPPLHSKTQMPHEDEAKKDEKIVSTQDAEMEDETS